MSKQTFVKPQGIITEPNKVGQFQPGACARMENCGVRSFGLIESCDKWTRISNFQNGTSLTGGAYAISDQRVTVMLTQAIVDTPSSWRILVYDGANGTFTGFAVSTVIGSALSNNGRSGIIFFRNRLIITTPSRSFAYDLFLPPPGDPGAPELVGWRYAGTYQPVMFGRNWPASSDTTAVGVLQPNTHFTALAQLRNIQDDGYELVSIPSFPFDFANLSTTIPQIRNLWTVWAAIPFVSSRWKWKLDVFHTRSQSTGYDSGANKYTPVSAGSSAYLSQTADVTAHGFIFPEDSTMENALGEALLTNNAASGAAAIPLPPPPCKTAAVYKSHAFYANRWDSSQIQLLSPYYWGFIPSTASVAVRTYGVGSHSTLALTAASGSAVITGFVDTLGYDVSQQIYVFRTDTGASVLSGTVTVVGATTITVSDNSTYSGSVYVLAYDVVELNGVTCVAPTASQLSTELSFTALWQKGDVWAIALEAQSAQIPAGSYPSFVPTGGMTIRLRSSETMSFRATNGQNYSPALPRIDAGIAPLDFPGKQLENSFAWSEQNQPEYVPPANYAFVGQGEIYRVIDTRDALWFFCSDGLFRLSGSGGDVANGYDWSIDPIDPKLVLSGVNAAVVHREYVYAYTNRGFVSISSEGTIRELSDGRVNWSRQDAVDDPDALAQLPNFGWQEYGTLSTSYTNVWVCADAATDDIYIKMPNVIGSSTAGSTMWVYNTKTDTFVTRRSNGSLSTGLWTPDDMICATYNPYDNIMLMVPRTCGGSISVGPVTPRNPSASFPEQDAMFIQFQPFYGGTSTNSAYTMKHWQDVQVSFKTPQPQSNLTVALSFGPTNTSAETNSGRVVPVVQATSSAFGENARVGFTVPRNAPAVSNALSISMSVSVTPATATNFEFAIEGFLINYLDFTDQRGVR